MLPIREIAPQILARLGAGNRLVLVAPPGSGKTTQVPQILADADPPPRAADGARNTAAAPSGQILILQPRRLAARMVAARVAAERRVPLGGEVGYSTRHDSRSGPATRLLYLTEGLFLRRLLATPDLPGVRAVLLDEFHERSLDADLALGLVKRLQETRRPDLLLIVMSATLDPGPIAEFLACPRLEATGRAFPVEIRYLPGRTRRPPWELAADALAEILPSREPGDVLVFMPGAYEIRRTIDAGRRVAAGAGLPVEFLPLHGALPGERQDAALAPLPGRRKVVVATNVAETSITIDGIRHVIDAGLAKIHRHDPRRGLNVLLIEPVSRAATEQRAGRAGRTAPGVCRRLWCEAEQHARPAHTAPEIRRVDLAEAVLHLRALGERDVRRFPWLEPPPEAALAHAEGVLRDLGALAPDGALTARGRAMAAFPLHPRLARMLLEAAGRGVPADRAALWAALVGEREIDLPGGGRGGAGSAASGAARAEPPAGLRSDLEALERRFAAARAARFAPDACAALHVSPDACREVERVQKALARALADATASAPAAAPAPAPRAADATTELVKSLLAAFPDHVAFRPDAGRAACLMTGRKRVALDARSAVAGAGLLLALDIWEVENRDGLRTELSLAAALEESWLSEIHPARVLVAVVPTWNAATLAVEAVEEHRFDEVVFRRVPRAAARGEATTALLVEQLAPVVPGGLPLDGWGAPVEQWIARTRWVARRFPERRLPAYDVDEIRLILHEVAAGAVRYAQVKDRPCLGAVTGALAWSDREFVEKMAPAELPLPSGRRLRLEYPALPAAAGAAPPPIPAVDAPPGAAAESPSPPPPPLPPPPRGRARIQELYGLAETPRVAGGRCKVLLEILAPSQRPVQVTDDLASFWRVQYPELRRELARRYPKHEWR